MEIKNVFLASAVVVFALILAANLIFYSEIESENLMDIQEEKLIKNKGLTLLPGEVYSYTLNNDIQNYIEFKIKLGQNCMGIYVADQYTGVCINSQGLDEGGSNFTFVHPQVVFFKPWMLALEEDWEWKVEYFHKNSDEVIMEYGLKVVGTENVFGRNCYVVNLTGPGGNTTQWIDTEKRVLIKETGLEYEINIIDAPFELEN